MTHLLNYTSAMTPQQSAAIIETALQSVGATNIAKSYENLKLKAISFEIRCRIGGQEQNGVFLLSVDIEAVKRALDEARKPKKGRAASKKTNPQRSIEEQAARTAWKILADEIKVMCARIQIEKTNPVIPFLAYITNGKNTFGQMIEKNIQLPKLIGAMTESVKL